MKRNYADLGKHGMRDIGESSQNRITTQKNSKRAYAEGAKRRKHITCFACNPFESDLSQTYSEFGEKKGIGENKKKDLHNLWGKNEEGSSAAFVASPYLGKTEIVTFLFAGRGNKEGNKKYGRVQARNRGWRRESQQIKDDFRKAKKCHFHGKIASFFRSILGEGGGGVN